MHAENWSEVMDLGIVKPAGCIYFMHDKHKSLHTEVLLVDELASRQGSEG